MSFRPDAEGLLAIARATFVESVLPSLPAEKRHAGLMIANALGIAMRELGAGDDSSARDVAELATLLDASSPGPSFASLASLESELAARIRKGAFDEGAPSEALRAYLARSLDRAVSIDQPKSRAAIADTDEER